MSIFNLVFNHTAIRSVSDSFGLGNDKVFESFCGIRELRDSTTKIDEHLVKVSILWKNYIQRIFNSLEQVDSAVSVINQNTSKLYDVAICDITVLSYFYVPFSEVLLVPVAIVAQRISFIQWHAQDLTGGKCASICLTLSQICLFYRVISAIGSIKHPSIPWACWHTSSCVWIQV